MFTLGRGGGVWFEHSLSLYTHWRYNLSEKKGNILTYLTFFDNRPESFTPLNETRLRNNELWDPGYTEKKYTILKKETRAAPSVTIKEKHVNNQDP